MYHQKIPSYKGAQPFIYAVYCKEDEALAFPVLARMHNEGFRICCAPATGVASDFYTLQRLSSAAGVIIFSSAQLAERLRTGEPEIVAAARSAVVRTVIMLDGTDIEDSAFAMSVPDHQPYRRENDSAFWLYIYNNDHFDNCRGPWPENKIPLRNPTYEELNEEVVNEEYMQIESIMLGSQKSKQEHDPFDPDNIYKNNEGYIEPEPDEFVYEPLQKVAAVRTEQDDEYDELLGMITLAENAAAEVHKRAMENIHEAAAPAEREPYEWELPDLLPEAVQAEELPEEEHEPEYKVDLIVTPVEPAAAAVEVTEEPEEVFDKKEIAIPTEEENKAAAQVIIASAELLREERAVPQEPAAEIKPENEEKSAPRRSSVPVMVKRQAARRVKAINPIKCKVIYAADAPEKDERSSAESLLPAVGDNASLEQYIRDIARSVVNSEMPAAVAQTEEPPASPRKHRRRNSTVAENAEQVAAQSSIQQTDSIDDAVIAEGEEGEETRTARKSRHPHQKGALLAGIISALRGTRSEKESEESEIGEQFEESKEEAKAEAKKNDYADDLHAAIEKFVGLNSLQSRTVVPRTMVRRYRD